MRTYSLPADLDSRIQATLTQWGYALTTPSKLTSAILKLSDFYIASPTAPTPWDQDWARAAYLSYFFPLNWIRSRAVCDEASRLGFWQGLDHFVDFGSGLGSLSWHLAQHIAQGQVTDHNSLVLRLQKEFLGPLASSPSSPKRQSTLWATSYVLTETGFQLPAEALMSEALLFIEPSTRSDGRALLRLRQDLIAQGYSIWAPCLHQEACPLLTHSERDWCHDRVRFSAPAWWEQLEKNLPIKNTNLTFSYLLARRSSPSILAARTGYQKARLTGDLLEEKGKSRQLICRNSNREFLSYFPQRLESEILQKWEDLLKRGELIEIKTDLTLKGSEVRISASTDIF